MLKAKIWVNSGYFVACWSVVSLTVTGHWGSVQDLHLMRGPENGPQGGRAVHVATGSFSSLTGSLAGPVLSALCWPHSKLDPVCLWEEWMGVSGCPSSWGKWGKTLQYPSESHSAFALPRDSSQRDLCTDGLGVWLTREGCLQM